MSASHVHKRSDLIWNTPVYWCCLFRASVDAIRSTLLTGRDAAAGISVCNTEGEDWRWTPVTLPAGAMEPSHRTLHGTTMLSPKQMVVYGGVSLADNSELNDAWCLSLTDGAWAWTTPQSVGSFDRKLKYQAALEAAKLPDPQPLPADGQPHFELCATEEGSSACWLQGHRWLAGGAHTLTLQGLPEEGIAKVQFFLKGAASGDPDFVANAAPWTFKGTDEDGAHTLLEGDVAVTAVIVYADEDVARVTVTESATVLSPTASAVTLETGPPVAASLPLVVAIDKRLLVFGGDVAGEPTPDVCVADASDFTAPMKWQEPVIVPANALPSARKGVSAIKKGKKVFMFSGHVLSDSGEYEATTEMYALTLADSQLTVEPIEQLGEFLPEGRAGAVFQDYSKDEIFMFGGMAADGKALNDGWLFNVVTFTWSLIYNGHPDLALPTGALCCMLDGKLTAINSAVGSPKLDLGATLDFVALQHEYDFVPKMKHRASELLADLSTWLGAQEHGLSHDPKSLSSNFNHLLETMASLYEVRRRVLELYPLFVTLARLCSTSGTAAFVCRPRSYRVQGQRNLFLLAYSVQHLVSATTQPETELPGHS